MDYGILEIIKYFPKRLRDIFYNVDISTIERITEIRLKAFCPLLVLVNGRLMSVSPKSAIVEAQNGVTVFGDDVEYVFNLLIKESVYAYNDEITNCFVTVDGGHRVGISGSAVIRNGNIIGVKNVSGLYFRIAREIIGCADRIISHIKNGEVYLNTIIAAPPGKGKTTLLRELARLLSANGVRTAVIDERHEIAAMNGYVSSFDLSFCDVLDGFPKAEGIERAVRTLSPDVVIFDELGNYSEVEAISYALNCGAGFITSVHAGSVKELFAKPVIKLLTDIGAVDLAMIYDMGRIKEVKYLKGVGYVQERSFELDIHSLCPDGHDKAK